MSRALQYYVVEERATETLHEVQVGVMQCHVEIDSVANGGYVAVDKDKYIAVLESRMPVFIMLMMVFVGLVAYAFALTYFI